MEEQKDDQVMGVKQEGPEDDPYTYPSQTRLEIIEELLDHAVRSDDRKWRFAWNVKINFAFNDSGKRDEETSPFDARWKDYFDKKSSDIFFNACEDMGRTFTDGEYTTYPGDDQGDYKFYFAGKSGGWLVLDEVAGINSVRFDSRGEIEDDLLEMSSNQLKKLYRLVRNLDRDLTKNSLKSGVEEAYVFQRENKEDEWGAVLDDAKTAASHLLDSAVRDEDYCYTVKTREIEKMLRHVDAAYGLYVSDIVGADYDQLLLDLIIKDESLRFENDPIAEIQKKAIEMICKSSYGDGESTLKVPGQYFHALGVAACNASAKETHADNMPAPGM